jgi:pimeloyl-ACP methyl ester carboxylesterase
MNVPCAGCRSSRNLLDSNRDGGSDMTLTQANSGTIQANGTELYFEIRGRGPTVLCISGATGDAGHFAWAAEQLADEFTVVTYDRRGNSRSPRPQGWTETSMAEQADDAAGLVRALRVAPVAAFGTSGGGTIGTELMLRQPDVLRGIVLHEPVLVAPFMAPEEAVKSLAPVVEPAMASGGPRRAVEAFVRHFATDANYERLEPEMRERMLANADAFLGVELQAFLRYKPASAALLASRVPMRVGIGTTSVPDAVGGAHWLADVLGVGLTTIPGSHTPYWDDAELFARTIRPILHEFVA